MSPRQASLRLPDATRTNWLVAACYLLLFLALDWASFIRPFQGLNITPWNPHPALAVALLMWNRRWLPLVWLGLIAAEVAVRGQPENWFVMLMALAVLALCYAAIARAADLWLDHSLALATRRDLMSFTAIVGFGALLSGTGYVLTYAVAGLGPSGPLAAAIARYWVGDAVGLLVTLPMLMVLMDPQRRAALAATLRHRDWWMMCALIVLLLVIVFARDDRNHFKFFYLLLLPVIWASARLGLAGAVLSAVVTQIGLILAVESVPQPDLTVFELQVLMAALTMTGLILGVAVDERERAEAGLKGSLRLAAAGQMAAALAHELSQPLTALNSYAQASRLVAGDRRLTDAERLGRMAEVSERMAEDALRASEVVKRLRDFFRTGSTQLEPTNVPSLLREAVEALARRADAQGIEVRLESEVQADVLADPIQIAIVLRNLLTNAMDAAAAAVQPGRVSLSAAMGDGLLRIEVRDNGAGVDKARLQQLFEPGPTDKPGGMGVGLSICRAIVEAHGGSLWAEAGPGGHFCFTLPLDSNLHEEPGHAP